jgi:hypothetical protein
MASDSWLSGWDWCYFCKYILTGIVPPPHNSPTRSSRIDLCPDIGDPPPSINPLSRGKSRYERPTA